MKHLFCYHGRCKRLETPMTYLGMPGTWSKRVAKLIENECPANGIVGIGEMHFSFAPQPARKYGSLVNRIESIAGKVGYNIRSWAGPAN